MSQAIRLMVVVVNYNQNQEIEKFLNSLKQAWPVSQTIVVDDGSTDGSLMIAERCGYSVLKHERNFGIGAAIRTGILFAVEKKYDAVAIMSSNGKMDVNDLGVVIAPILSGEADYVTGTRFKDGGRSDGLPPFRRIMIPVVSVFLGLFLFRFFSDITCGFRAYRLDFLRDSRVLIEQSWLNRYEMEYYLHFWACKLKLRIKEVPVSVRYDHLPVGRKSKIPPITGWWSMLKPIIYLRFGIRK